MRGYGLETVQLPTVSPTGVHDLPYGETFGCCFNPKHITVLYSSMKCIKSMHSCTENWDGDVYSVAAASWIHFPLKLCMKIKWIHYCKALPFYFRGLQCLNIFVTFTWYLQVTSSPAGTFCVVICCIQAALLVNMMLKITCARYKFVWREFVHHDTSNKPGDLYDIKMC